MNAYEWAIRHTNTHVDLKDQLLCNSSMVIADTNNYFVCGNLTWKKGWLSVTVDFIGGFDPSFW